ncbi:MAG: metallophosphoesterase [Alphaproteobacteria bacterium]|nr:metallophosphoesterase [Alphaproteobacteria bacterium]
MKLARIISRSFLWIAMLLIVVVSMVMGTHIFFNERHFDTGYNSFPPAAQYLAPNAKRFSVALVSDSATGNRVFEQVIQDIRQSDKNYSFVLHLGDFVKDYFGDYYWTRSRIEPYLGDTPMYSIPGNHDISRRHHIDKTAYKSVMGAPYYWFGYGDVLFIALDLSNTTYVDDEMLQWFSDTLNKIRPTFQHCVVYGHIPPHGPVSTDGYVIDTNRVLKPDVADKIKQIVRGHKIDAMFFGHVHYWSENTFAKIPTYTLPASGQKARSGYYGYVSMTIGPKGIESIEPHYIDFHGPVSDKQMMRITDNIGYYKTCRAVRWLLYVIVGCLIGAVLSYCTTFRRK